MAATDKVIVDIITNTDQAQKNTLKFAAGVGAAVLAVRKLIGEAKELVDAYAVQEQAEARLEQTLKATGYAAGLTATELKNMAAELQAQTKFGDEAIIGAETLLLTFKQIGEETFPRATEAILDLSEGMGQDLKSSAVQIGKALNDPIAGVSALTRVGIQFTDTQKEMIQGFVDTNQLAKAQDVILTELESQFGGVAKAAGDTATGTFTKLANVTGDLREAFGQLIANGLEPAAENSIEVVNRFTELISKHNELAEAMNAQKEGTASAEQNLAVYTERLIGLKKAQTDAALINKSYADNFNGQIAALENMIALEKQRAQQEAYQLKLTEQMSAAERAAEEHRAAAAAAHQLDLDNLAEAYAQTTQGQIDALEAQIAYYESFQQTGRVLYVLDELNEKLKTLKENETDLADENEESSKVVLQNILNRMNAEQQLDALIDDARKKEIENLEELRAGYEEAALSIISSSNDIGFAFGEALASGKSFNDAIGELGKSAAVTILKTLGEEAAARAAVLWALSLVPGGQANIPGAIAMTAASAGAFVAAGAVSAFATGGDFMTNGPQLMLVGDNPGGRERVTITPEGSANINGPKSTSTLILEIQPRGLIKPMQTLINNQEIIIR